MDSTGSVSAVESALDRLAKQRSDLEELWAARKLRLDLCLRLRLFERDALEVSKILLIELIVLDNELWKVVSMALVIKIDYISLFAYKC